MPRTSAKDETKVGKARGRGVQAPAEGAPAGPSKLETDGDRVIVAGVDVSDAAAIPTGIPLNDGQGSVFLVVEPGMLVQDPEVNPGREAEEYTAEDEDMQELVASMRAHAASHPLGVGNHTNIILRRGPSGEVWIVAGRRRHEGAGFAGTKLAAILRPEMTTAQATVTAITENGQRTGASALGEARQFADLRDKHGMKVAAIVEATGKQQAFVSRRLALLTLPEWAQAMLRTGTLTEGTAYEGMAKFAKVPEPARSEMWATLNRRWAALEKEPAGITAARLRMNLNEIARNLSRPLDPSTFYRGETPPVFDLAAHDAACNCGRPKIGLSDNGVCEHVRCYNVTVWERLQTEAKAARARALQVSKSASKAAELVAAVKGSDEANTEGAEPQPIKPAAPARVAPRYTSPTWDDVENLMGGSKAARDSVLSGDHTADEIKSAAPDMVLDVNALSVDGIRIVQAPQPGLFRVICTDAEALKAATDGGAAAVVQRTERIRQEDRATFREAAAKVELRSPEVLAALVMGFGNAPTNIGITTAEKLGLGDFKNAKPAKIAELPKKDLTLWLQGIAYRVIKQDTSSYSHYDNTAERARAQIVAETTEDFLTLLAAVPGPELTSAGRMQVRAGRVVALMEGVQELVARHDDTQDAGAFADELSEYAPKWAEAVQAFRDECNALAAEGVALGIELDTIGNPHGEGSLSDLIGDAAALLAHPVIGRITTQARHAAQEAVASTQEGAEARAAEPGEPAQEAMAGTQEAGEGAEAPAPEAEPGEPAQEAMAGTQEDGEGAEAPAPEAEPGEPAQEAMAGTQEAGEGAEAPAPEPEPGEPAQEAVAGTQEAGEGAEAPAPEAEPGEPAQVAPKGKNARRGGRGRK